MSIKSIISVANYYNFKYKFASDLEVPEINSVEDFWEALELESKQLVKEFMTEDPENLEAQEELKRADEIQFKIDNLIDKYFLIFKDKFSKDLNKENLKEFIEITMQEELESVSQELNISY